MATGVAGKLETQWLVFHQRVNFTSVDFKVNCKVEGSLKLGTW